MFAWDAGKGLQPARRLHGGRLCLPAVCEAATCAAAGAAAAASAATATAVSFGAVAKQRTSTGMETGEQHASLAASALRFLREGTDATTLKLPSDNRGEKLPEDAKGAGGDGYRVGWQADEEHLGALTWEMLCEGRRVIIFCPTQEWTARTATFLAK